MYFIFRPSRPYRRLKKVVSRLLLFALIFLSVSVALPWSYYLGAGRATAADNDWCDALAYLKDNTPQDAVIMTWWDYGYWIVDIAERIPVVDNGGLYSKSGARLRDIGIAYCATEASQAAQIMQKYGASYLIFSRGEIAILPVISQYGLDQEYGNRRTIPPELEESLFARALAEDFKSDGPLVVAYRNDGVVILRIQQQEL